MTNHEIINYIKLREAWKDTLRTKSNAISSIIGGLFRFGSFLAYWAVEKYFLAEEINQLYLRNPNYKYVFYLSLAFGLWGLVDSALGVWKYSQASSSAEELKKQVEDLERALEKEL